MELINRRALKVYNLCKKGQIEFSETRKEDGVRTFKSALTHAQKLKSRRQYYVTVCRLNLAIAYLDTWDWGKSLGILEGLRPYAEQNEPSLLECIWHYIGVALKKRANGGEECSRETNHEIKAAFDKSKHYADSEAQNHGISTYIEHTLENLVSLEEVTRKRRDLLARRIDIKHIKDEQAIELKVELVRHMMMDDPVKAKSAVKEHLNIERLFPNKEAKQNVDASTWCDLGLLFTEVRTFGIAKQCFRSALEYRTNTNAEDCFLLRHNIAAIYILEEDYQDAINEYQDALETYEGQPGTLHALDRHVRIRNKDFVTHVYLNVAYCYLRLGDHGKAYKYYKKVLALKKDGIQGYQLALEGLMAAVLLKQKSTKSLESFKLELGLMDCKLVGSKEEIQQYLQNIAAKVLEINDPVVEHNYSNAANENKSSIEEGREEKEEKHSKPEEKHRKTGKGNKQKAKKKDKQVITE